MNHKFLHQVSIVIVLITAGLLTAFLLWQYKINQPKLISQELAIQNAIEACPGIGLQPVEQPTEFRTELTTYGMASNDPIGPPDIKTRVWVVTMKGRWQLTSGPPPDPNSDPVSFYWDECTIIIDAQTGKSLSYPIE